jgi:RNA polymerase sigma-70 factor (ECF subfamily)
MTQLSLEHVLLDCILDQVGSAPPAPPVLRDALWRALRQAGWAPVPSTRQQPLRPTTSDEALVQAFLAGDASAFEELVARHLGALVGYARRSLPRDQAEDAVQEMFVVLYRKAAKLEPGSNIRAYLFGVLRKEIIRILTHKSRAELASESVPDQADESASALDRLADDQEARRLAEALEATCNPLEQQVILLARDGAAGPEIARALGLQETHVRVLKHRAVAKLRAHLAGDDS